MPEGEITRETEHVQHPKILRVNERYGKNALERKVLDQLELFLDAGIEVIIGGEFNPSNPNEIGLYARSHYDFGNSINRKRNLEVATEADLLATMPEAYVTRDEVLNAPLPFVAKSTHVHRGEGKILIQSEEDRNKYIAVAFCQNIALPVVETINEVYGTKYDIPEQKRALEQLLQKVRERNFDDTFTDVSEKFVAERYIETPSEYNTSFRLIVDAFGNVHAGVLFRSGNKKIEDVVDDSNRIPANRHFAHHVMNNPNEDYLLLTHPQSPLYISSPKIISNASTDEEILLNSKQVTDPINREVLLAHGINPDIPQIPDEIKEMAKKVGIASRGDVPYVGVDIMQEGTPPNVRYYFIEANQFPEMMASYFPELPSDTTYQDTKIAMLRRVIQAWSTR